MKQKSFFPRTTRLLLPILTLLGFVLLPSLSQAGVQKKLPLEPVKFSHRSAISGNWSDPKTWQPAQVPGKGARVLVSRGTRVTYDVEAKEPIRLIQVVGTLTFARDRNTELNVGLVKVQNSDICSESGFACDFHTVNKAGEPTARPKGPVPTLEIGTPEQPIPAKYTARIRLHYFPGMDKNDAPAIACCAARMEIHGASLSRTWVELGADVKPGTKTVVLSEPVSGWKVGDEIIVTGSKRKLDFGSFRDNPKETATEKRRITKIEGKTLTVDEPFVNLHYGTGKHTSEVANLSRNVIIESADPKGLRGHTVYHRFSQGGISYARFAHLGKEGVLGRYPIHYHLVGDTMRGSSVIGVAIVDSHNRWVTIHGTQYLLVRDCVGYQSVGHGFFLEDGTEIYNILDRNLGVHAYEGNRLPKQVLPFDPNDGAAFWWANGRNTFVRNVACENDQYGYRFDSQLRSNFDSHLPILMPDGKKKIIDIRKLPIYRFEHNETHTEGLYGLALAGTDGAGPATKHPHMLKNLHIWETHYGLRAQLPTMWIENVNIHRVAYGIYRPWFENHAYRNLHIDNTNTEPFNRGLDDRSLQHGKITVDGLTFSNIRFGYVPMIQISANNASGDAESHFRNVKVLNWEGNRKRALVNLGGGPRLQPKTPKGVPIYIHDWYGPGEHAKVVSTRAKDLLKDGNKYRKDEPLTGNESVVAKVKNIPFPKLLDPVDDLPPATIITSVRKEEDQFLVRGVTQDNGPIASINVNGRQAVVLSDAAGVVDWEITVPVPKNDVLVAHATDEAGNVEQMAHRWEIGENGDQ